MTVLGQALFKKESRSRSGKGVDIQLSVDMLSHVFRGNVDSVLLMSGDGCGRRSERVRIWPV